MEQANVAATNAVGKVAFFQGCGPVTSLKCLGMPLISIGRVTTPKKYFESRPKSQVEAVLEKKFGPPRSVRDTARTYYNPTSMRSYNVHQDPAHQSGRPHVDIRRRGGYPERIYYLREA